MTTRTVTVLAPGPLATIQDLGRLGLGHLGIGRSGAADLASLRRGNLLLGNDPGAAAIETTLGGLRLRFDADAVVALTGAACEVSIGGRHAAFGAALRIRAGEEMRCRTPRFGVRSYLAVDGGIDVPTVLGSRSTDTLSGLGPAPLTAGMTLPLGRPGTPSSAAALPPLATTLPPGRPAPSSPVPVISRDEQPAATAPLALLPGPRADWFTPAALELLFTAQWSVTPRSDRVGIRLAGPPLTRLVRRELPSEPMVAGALQVPPDGQPILFLADHPVTGGYPVIGVVPASDLGHAAQLRPGTGVRFAGSGRAHQQVS